MSITKDDLVVCECGGEFFVQAMRVAKKKSPVIGEKPIITPVQGEIACLMCKKVVNDMSKTKGDLNVL